MMLTVQHDQRLSLLLPPSPSSFYSMFSFSSWSGAGKVPSSQSYHPLKALAAASQSQAGYARIWRSYDASTDSARQVTRESYLSCNTSDWIWEYRDCNTQVDTGEVRAVLLHRWVPLERMGKKVIVVGTMCISHLHMLQPKSEGPVVAPRPTSGASGLEGGLIMAKRVMILGLF